MDPRRGEAAGGVPDRPRRRSDSAFADVPAKVMELHERRSRRASSTRTRRDVSLDVRLTETERAAIRTRAHVLGVKPSTWARAVMLDALDARREHVEQLHHQSTEVPLPELARAVEQLRRVGVNLNQTKRDGSAVDEDLLHLVIDAVDVVRASLGDRTAS